MNDQLSGGSNNKFSPSYAADYHCELGQVTILLPALLFLSVKWGPINFNILVYLARFWYLALWLLDQWADEKHLVCMYSAGYWDSQTWPAF